MAREIGSLDYLREPRFVGYSAEMFGSALRLPVWGAIFELTPIPEEDTIYARQIIAVTDTDAGNTMKEIQRTERLMMIRRLEETKVKKTVDYTRLPSPRWSIVEIALKSAKSELDL
ncbi:hypothetical protein HYS84_03040 [Candidatus Saccharibacteria bacterium]|nr:hypothetical protein [Candidatus Saccharibacteria bacterium]